jgi:hypothetical protein
MTNLQTTNHTLSLAEYEVIRSQAESLVKTGFLPQAIKTPEQALAIILTGRELGIPAMTALNGINVIQGKPTISPQLMLGLIERSGQLDNIKIDMSDEEVSVTMKRKGRSAHTEVFGWEQAKAMQLVSKDNYRKQATTMFKWRAVSACARVVFPDVLLGLYTHEELAPDATYNEDGEFVDSIAQNVVESQSEVVIEAELVEEPKPAKKTSGKKKAIEDDILKAEWIAYCGQGFRALNELNVGAKWNKETINDLIIKEFGVEGGIHNLSLAQVEQLAKTIDAFYIGATEVDPVAANA